MKHLLWLLAALLLTGVIVYGTLDASAWAADGTIQPGKVVISGPPDLRVSGGPLSARNLAPGDAFADIGTLCARNQGEKALNYRGWFRGADRNGRLLVLFTQMRVEKQAAGGWRAVKTLRGYPGVGGDRLFNYFQFPGPHLLSLRRDIVTGRLAPGQQECYRFSARLAEVASNALQDQALNFDVYFAAVFENSGW